MENMTLDEILADKAVARWKEAGIEFALIIIMRQAYSEGIKDSLQHCMPDVQNAKSLAKRYMEIHPQIVTKGGWQQFKYWLQNEVKNDC
jgi:hypothetical protein